MRTLAEVAKQIRELPEGSKDVTIQELFDSRHEAADAMVDLVVPSKSGNDLHLSMFDMRKQLQIVTTRCPRLQALYSHALHTNPNSLQTPWRIIMYYDEMIPGNVLAPMIERKTMNLYYNFVEVGRRGLSSEAVWFTLATIRTSQIKLVSGGWSTVLAAIIRHCFCGGCNISAAGFTAMLPAGPRVLFARLGYVLADLDAHRQGFDLKGASGLKPCILCSNVTMKGADLASRSGDIVEISCCDVSKFEPASSADIYQLADIVNVAYARWEAGRMTKKSRENIELCAGVIPNRFGVLAAPDLRGVFLPSTMLLYDPMHTLLSNGTLNWELQNFMINSRMSWAEWAHLGDIAWEYPGYARTMAYRVRRVLSARTLTKNEGGRFFASEALAIYPLVRHFAELYYEKKDPDNVYFRSLQLACNFVDNICKAKYSTKMDEAALTRMGSQHFAAFQKAYGSDAVKPKHHYALHLPSQIVRNQAVYDCFVTERKHSILKRLANNITTTARFEWSLAAVAHVEQQRQLDAVQLDTGLRGDTCMWEGITIARKAMIDGASFCVGDVVCHGEVRKHANVPPFYINPGRAGPGAGVGV